MTRWRPPLIRENTLRLVTLTPEPMGLRPQWYTSDKILSQILFGMDVYLCMELDNGYKEKNMGIYIFLQLFGMTRKLLIALNKDIRSVAYRLFNLHYFLSHFVFHSLKLVAYIRMDQILFFFARKFRQQSDSEGEVVTFRSWRWGQDAFHYLTHTRVTYHITWPESERFQSGRR